MRLFQFANCLRVSVVAHLSGISKICVISVTIVEMNADPLSVMGVVGRYECFVMISISTLATFAAVASNSGCANKYHETTSIAVITVLYPPLLGKFGSTSIRMASSGQWSHSGKLSSAGVIVLFGTLLSDAHNSHPSTHFLFCDPWVVMFLANFLQHF